MLSHERVARALGIAKGSVANYLAAAQAAGLSGAQVRELNHVALLARLRPPRYVLRAHGAPDFAAVHRELHRNGVTLELLWQQYCDGCGPCQRHF